MKKLTIYFIIINALIFSIKLDATHYMGNEIRWECLSNGHYRFITTIYGECYYNGGPAVSFGSYITLQSNLPSGAMNLYLAAGYPKSISPVCKNDPALAHITCTGMINGTWLSGTLQEYVYTSDSLFPNGVLIKGIPPTTGFVFWWDGCCRNPSTNIASSVSSNYIGKAIMYPFKFQSAFPCYDNAPTFAEKPKTLLPSGTPISFSNHAQDADLDSLNYTWDSPMNTVNQPITSYSSGYGYNHPFAGTTQNQNNIPAELDSTTGIISLTSYTAGSFITNIKVSSYRDGIKISEIWRDFEYIILNTGSNIEPSTSPVFNNGTSYETTVYAGDTVEFIIVATDFQFQSNNSPQNAQIKLIGQQLGGYIAGSSANTGYLSDSTGCIKPPCATISPAPQPNEWLSANFGIQTSFNWKTNCDHLNPFDTTSNNQFQYQFELKVSDDFCPIPATYDKVIKINIVDQAPLPSPLADSIYFDYTNLQVNLSWEAVVDTLNQFDGYYIYKLDSAIGTYLLLDSITNINTTNYTDNTGLISSVYYKIKTKSHTICKNNFYSPLATEMFLIQTNIENAIKKDGFYVFQNKPNPAKDFTEIEFLTNTAARVNYKLISITGRIIENREINTKPGSNKIVVDLSRLPSGTYIYTFVFNGISKAGKIIVL